MVRWRVATAGILTAALAFWLVSVPVTAQQARGGGGFTQPEPIAFDDHEGWKSIFDGDSIKDWDGNPDFWRLADSAIVGESTREKPSGTTYIIWKGGESFLAEAEVAL